MKKVLNQFKQDIAIKGFSICTEKNYVRYARKFIEFTKLPAAKLDSSHIRNYLYNMVKVQKLSNSTICIAYSAIKFLFCQTLQKPWEIKKIPQVKCIRKLPVFFSFEEVDAIIRNSTFLKHKAALMLIYSSGLRVSECTRIKLTDIYRKNMKLLVRQAKGNKDRYTILSKKCLSMLEKYYRIFRPKDWLFTGRFPDRHIAIRTLQHAYHNAKEKAGISKQYGIHTLRHSFATHFLEAGGGIFQLQKLLGHKNLKTTLVYIHLQEEKITAQSPLDVFGHEDY